MYATAQRHGVPYVHSKHHQRDDAASVRPLRATLPSATREVH